MASVGKEAIRASRAGITCVSGEILAFFTRADCSPDGLGDLQSPPKPPSLRLVQRGWGPPSNPRTPASGWASAGRCWQRCSHHAML